MKLSAHFDRAEFQCKCGCKLDTVDVALLEELEAVRGFFNSPVTITSGMRCLKHNKDVGGMPGSYHLIGKAADIRVLGHTPKEIADYVEDRHAYRFGVGRYQSFTHIDCRDTVARWG